MRCRLPRGGTARRSPRGRDIKTIFRRPGSLNLRLSLFALVSCALLVADHRGALVGFRSVLATLIYPVQQTVSAPTRMFRAVVEALGSYGQLLDENRRLRAEQLVLNTRLLKFATLERENIRLRGLLETSFKVGEQMLVAEVLSVNLAPYEHLVVVNKGSRFGVHVGQPVFDAHGVVGQVVRVSRHGAEVLLITDVNHGIPVQVDRNGLRTVAVGSGQIDRLVLPYLSGSADIQAGDLLVTSGMGGLFPQGYPVAVVADVAHQSTPFAKVTATPSAPLDRLREILLVWSKPEPIPRLPEQSGAPLESAAREEPAEVRTHAAAER